jgi:hypothetical protein
VGLGSGMPRHRIPRRHWDSIHGPSRPYSNVSQTVVRGPQVVFGFCPCGPLRLNISPKETEKNKINMNYVSHTIVENL